jgi:hypothetical protein
MVASTATLLQGRANFTCLGRFVATLPAKALFDAFADGFAVPI